MNDEVSIGRDAVVFLLLLAALVCFVVAAVWQRNFRPNLVAVGLALATAAALVA